MSYFGTRTHDYLGIKDLRRRNEQFVLKDHLRLADGKIISLGDLRNNEEFKGMDRAEQRRYERAAKDGAMLSESEGAALVNPETGKVTDDFGKQDQTRDTGDRLNRAMESQEMKAVAKKFNEQQAERGLPAPVRQEEEERGRQSGEGGVDEPYVSRREMENRSQEESDLLVSEIEQFYPDAVAEAEN